MPATFQKQRKHLRWGPSAAELAPMFHKMVQIQNRSIPSQPSVTDTGCWNDDLIHLLRLSHAVRALEWGAQPSRPQRVPAPPAGLHRPAHAHQAANAAWFCCVGQKTGNWKHPR